MYSQAEKKEGGQSTSRCRERRMPASENPWLIYKLSTVWKKCQSQSRCGGRKMENEEEQPKMERSSSEAVIVVVAPGDGEPILGYPPSPVHLPAYQEASPPTSPEVSISCAKYYSIYTDNLQEQLDVLDKERDKALNDLTMLRRSLRRGSVDINDLNINLMPVINHQRKTNASLERSLKRVYKHVKEVRQMMTDEINLLRDVDEVDSTSEKNDTATTTTTDSTTTTDTTTTTDETMPVD